MKRPKKEKGSVRLDAVPMLPERIWQEIGSYSGQKWALPKNRTPLENLIGIEETNNLYGMTNSAEQNIHLHDLLFAKLRDENEQVRDASIEWIVTDWGGIISDSDTHKGWYKELKTYSELEVAAFIKKYYDDRVASWSKVLAFADSQNYAIYDARVAMSLNVILDKVGYKDRFYMFGTRIKNYEEVFSHMRQHVHTKYIGKQPFYMGYQEYILLLKAMVAQGLASDILNIEMRLFASADALADDYIQKHGVVLKS